MSTRSCRPVLVDLVGAGGFAPPTSCVSGSCSTAELRAITSFPVAEGGGFEPPRPSRDGLGSAIRRITALPPFRVLLVARAGVAPAPPVFQAGALLPELPRVVPGSEGRIRTDDQRVTKPLLWPLSYLGTFLAPRAGLEPARALARRLNRAVWLPVSPPRNVCFWRRARDSNPDSLLRETAVFETGAIAVRPAPRIHRCRLSFSLDLLVPPGGIEPPTPAFARQSSSD